MTRCAAAILIVGSLALAALVMGGRAVGQAVLQVFPSEVKGAVPAAAAPVAQPAATPAAPGTPAAAAANESERLKRLKTLTYDRRPSAILRAWSTPPDADAEEKKDEKKEEKKPAEGKPADAKPAGGDTPAAAAQAASPAAPAAAAPAASADPPAAPAAEEAKPQPADEAAKKQEEVKKKAEEEAKKKQEEIKALEKELKALQRNVTLGAWIEVKTYLAGLPENEAKDGYAQMQRSLGGTPQAGTNPQGGGQPMSAPGIGAIAEQNVFRLEDVLGLAAACPHKHDKDSIDRLGAILRQAINSGIVVPDAVAWLQVQAAEPDHKAVLTRRQCALLLVAAGQVAEVQPFLPPLDEAVTAKDAEGINLLARCLLALHGKDRKPEMLEKAWQTIQASLALSEADKKQQEEALKLAVDLAPKIRDELGQTWLEESFTREPERGMNIMATIGATASTALQSQPHSPDVRQKALELQKTAVEALLKASAERAHQWQHTLGLLAHAWRREAEFSRAASSSSMYGPRMQRDVYGNFYYMNEDDEMTMGRMPQQGNQPRPIQSAQVLEAGPSEAWLAELDPEARPRFFAIYAQLYLKVAEEDRAYPYIERLAGTHPELARELVHEFLKVWTKGHDPNANRRYSNPYIFMYGFERKAESIPLTRSKQERNLKELSEWVKRLRGLNLKDLDESLFATAFTTCHSSAEVYRMDAIEQVLGSIDALEPKTLAELVQQMRQHLAGQWRMPAEQEQKKTRRKQKDIEAEVLRGYRLAGTVLENSLKKYPDNWRLNLAQACLTHDENNYQQALAPDSDFSHRRLEAIAQFRKAAELYAAEVSTLREEDQTTLPFEHWFYASLGASDLGAIDHKSTPDDRQPALIREALAALPGEAAEHHLGLFANTLFTRMSSAKPAVKYRYLKAGFEIVGDHKQAREARKVFDYYKDLVTEIKLATRVDGSATVGNDEPFGVFIELSHTREIERESGGFGRYLQNQNAGGNYFYYNYGRPLENYRDKFKEAVATLLAENFDVQSVTFQAEDVSSRAAAEYGWRVTPYAYMLLKARGPQVDKLPSLKMDLDFLDTSGFVILPILSSALPLDASKVASEGRPHGKLNIVQTLDERQASKGKLVLEVKATARGLVPPLDKILDMKFDEFEVTDIDDQGVSVSRFDPDSSEPAVLSERTCAITLTGRTDLAERPKSFAFPAALVDEADITYQRYNDADLAEVDRVVSLEEQYGAVERPWLWIALAAVPVVLVAGAVAWKLARRTRKPAERRFRMPETLTPFTVLALLRNIEQNNGLSTDAKRELSGSIQLLERRYFADADVPAPDLRAVAESWVSRAR
ncbi:MAG: hypothetical protein HYX69_03490 [Planctomycetia bacterium]|nr:hypothetical protein [Planctomycetia bacterium]